MHELAPEHVKAIARLHQMWIDMELAGNSAGVLNLCTEDALWMPPDGPLLVGTAALDLLEDPDVQVRDINITNLKVRGSGNVAYLTSHYTTRYTVPGNPAEHVGHGAQLWILHNLPPWKVAVVSWSQFEQRRPGSA